MKYKENAENMEKMVNINQMTKDTLLQKTAFSMVKSRLALKSSSNLVVWVSPY